ncbi:hypothetical protein [Oceanobacillus halophilus]|uniref:Permease n=1 Tax=Oceanobacillus halophilus TaxID=930130 RepID=A0A495A929_9BACI|nr:hypothetical protein [Oceanobacillus halophilus]RKQ35811.1 hypothetical protein D8M06_06030 [Oceanobacillus halophilus]
MQAVESWILRISIVLYAILHFITYFYESTILLYLLVFSGFCIFLSAILRLHIKKIKMPFALLIAGLTIMTFSGESVLEGLISGLVQMRNMIGLLIIVPMISWVLREESYIESIMGFAHNLLDTSRKFYFGIVSFTQIIAYFLLFGSILMMYQFVNRILKNEKGEPWENYKGTALLRGFSLSVMWVVSIPSFAYVVEVMDAPLGLSILQGLGISIAGIMVALIFSHFEEKRYGVDLTAGLQTEIDDVLSHTRDKKQMHRNVLEFFVLFITLFGTILILQAFVDLELLVLIPLIVLVWIVAYYLLKRRPKRLTQEAYSYFTKNMENQAYQLCVMLGAGILIYALNQTTFAQTVVDGIYAVQESIPFLNILYFLPFIIIILGFVGLGPLTVMVLVAGILETIHLPYPPELIVLSITSGSAISILLSPLIMPLIMLSGANGLNAFKNGIGFNWKYAVVIYVLVQGYVQVRLMLGG